MDALPWAGRDATAVWDEASSDASRAAAAGVFGRWTLMDIVTLTPVGTAMERVARGNWDYLLTLLWN